MMNHLKAGLEGIQILVYLDDIILLSQTFQDHLEDLQRTFSRLRENGLRVHREKSRFACQEVKYLGHRISKEGISMDPLKTSAIP